LWAFPIQVGFGLALPGTLGYRKKKKNTSFSSKQIFRITSSELHQISSKSSQ